MKFSISQPALENMLSKVARAKKEKTTDPLLDGVLIQVSGETVTFLATNLSTSIRSWTRIEDGVDGTVLVPVEELLKAASAARKSVKIELNSDGQDLRFKSGATNLILRGWDPADFPTIPTSNEDGVMIDRHLLEDLAATVAPFHDAARVRPVLECVNIIVSDGRLFAFASDGFKMGSIERETELSAQKILVSAEALIDEIAPVLIDAQVRLVTNPNNVIFRDSYSEIVCQLVEGNAPDFRALLPQDHKMITRVAIDVKELRDCIKRMMVVLEKGAHLDIEFSDGTMTLSGKSQRGELSDSMIVDQTGENLSVLVNVTYLKDILAVAEQRVKLEFTGSVGAIKITSPDIEGWVGVLVPLDPSKKPGLAVVKND